MLLGNNNCDEINNMMECNYDEGDCKMICPSPTFYEDGFCDDENNILTCAYDGGDCCPPFYSSDSLSYCDKCECLEGKFQLL